MLPIYESYPKNPSTTVVLNNFYPKGLKEIDIYKYYISVKKQLLEELKNREVMFFINPKINKSIVKRKDPKTGSFFKLTDNNYEKLITGRTVSVHSTMNKSESFGIIDIDFDDFNQAKKATNEIYNFCLDSISSKCQIKYTGKNSFHIICILKSKQDINQIKKILFDTLFKKFKNKYNFGRRLKNMTRSSIDLGSNMFRGGYIPFHSLSTLGLKCMEVKADELTTFQKENAKIKY